MVTMKDVAMEANVSLGSVSNVINGKEVKPDTYNKVMEAIKKLNYEKNDLATSFKNNKTNTVGLMDIKCFYAIQMLIQIMRLDISRCLEKI